MREIVWVDGAVNDLVRLQEFVAAKNPAAAQKAVQTIKEAVRTLQELPAIGKPVYSSPEYRDLKIRFGAAGYVLRYRFYQETVYILRIRHYREDGFNVTS